MTASEPATIRVTPAGEATPLARGEVTLRTDLAVYRPGEEVGPFDAVDGRGDWWRVPRAVVSEFRDGVYTARAVGPSRRTGRRAF